MPVWNGQYPELLPPKVAVEEPAEAGGVSARNRRKLQRNEAFTLFTGLGRPQDTGFDDCDLILEKEFNDVGRPGC